MHAGRHGDDGIWRVALLALQPQPVVRGDVEPREHGSRERKGDLDSADATAALGAGELCVCPARCPSIV